MGGELQHFSAPSHKHPGLASCCAIVDDPPSVMDRRAIAQQDHIGWAAPNLKLLPVRHCLIYCAARHCSDVLLHCSDVPPDVLL